MSSLRCRVRTWRLNNVIVLVKLKFYGRSFTFRRWVNIHYGVLKMFSRRQGCLAEGLVPGRSNQNKYLELPKLYHFNQGKSIFLQFIGYNISVIICNGDESISFNRPKFELYHHVLTWKDAIWSLAFKLPSSTLPMRLLMWCKITSNGPWHSRGWFKSIWNRLHMF